MKEQLVDIREYVDEMLISLNSTRDRLVRLKADKEEAEKDLIAAKEAQEILKVVARETQSEIEKHLSNITTMALSSVEVKSATIPKPPEFVVRMVERRGATECDLLFKEGEREQHPLECSGYGYVDVADYILRIAYILLEDEYCDYEVRKTLLSDEPFRNADPALQYKISEMLNMVSNDLGFQQIIVSHAEGVNIEAETTFHVTKTKKVSSVKKG